MVRLQWPQLQLPNSISQSPPTLEPQRHSIRRRQTAAIRPRPALCDPAPSLSTIDSVPPASHLSPPHPPTPGTMTPPTGDDGHYHPKDAIQAGLRGAAVYGGIGLLFAAVRNSLAKSHVGPWTTFTRGGGIIATFGTPRVPHSLSTLALLPSSSRANMPLPPPLPSSPSHRGQCLRLCHHRLRKPTREGGLREPRRRWLCRRRPARSQE